MPPQARACLTESAAWIGPRLQDDPSWAHRFDSAELAVLDSAVARAKARGLRVPFAAVDFPLPGLQPLLRSVLEEIEHGRGFKLLRGIPRSRYSDAECELREAYEDHPEPGRERHLLRMWIAVAEALRRPLAASLAGRYRWVREGGIPVKND
jgi:hypothetical protein